MPTKRKTRHVFLGDEEIDIVTKKNAVLTTLQTNQNVLLALLGHIHHLLKGHANLTYKTQSLDPINDDLSDIEEWLAEYMSYYLDYETLPKTITLMSSVNTLSKHFIN